MYKWLPIVSIPYILIIIDGIIKDNINVSKYLFIIGDDDDNDFATLWIFNPKINEDVLIKKDTVARIFPVIPGKIAIGVPCLVCDCGCALTVKLSS